MQLKVWERRNAVKGVDEMECDFVFGREGMRLCVRQWQMRRLCI